MAYSCLGRQAVDMLKLILISVTLGMMCPGLALGQEQPVVDSSDEAIKDSLSEYKNQISAFLYDKGSMQ
jgi:hypothetical protein